MSARGFVAEALAGALPGWRVVAAPVDLDAVTALTAVVYREDVKPGPVHGGRTSGLAVWVLVPQQDPRTAEDPLDDALDDALTVFDTVPALDWSEASRGVYADKFQGYKLTVSIMESA